ncbi:hypothetical protein AaE_009377 [Aphanomyces astaci]|uniref:C2H2-type domain-containing protein n=1 Tax=Aphanomyces astaci TaxID=112090 RepID=A0A6A5AAN1_APHAT|nr:hypothetical protein AaE_009377 [Aphanomyces astaci]
MNSKLVLKKSDGNFECPNCSSRYTNVRSLRAHCKRKHGVTVTVFEKKTIVHKQEQAKARKARWTATKTAIRAMRAKPIKSSKRDTFTFASARLRGAHEAVNPFVKIGELTIPGAGRGLFAAIDLLPGDICTAYDGTKVFVEPKDHAYACELGVTKRKSWLLGLNDPVAGSGLGIANASVTSFKREMHVRLSWSGHQNDNVPRYLKCPVMANRKRYPDIPTCSASVTFMIRDEREYVTAEELRHSHAFPLGSSSSGVSRSEPPSELQGIHDRIDGLETVLVGVREAIAVLTGTVLANLQPTPSRTCRCNGNVTAIETSPAPIAAP